MSDDLMRVVEMWHIGADGKPDSHEVRIMSDDETNMPKLILGFGSGVPAEMAEAIAADLRAAGVDTETKALPDVSLAVDYRALLKKYMAHVGLSEGTTFVGGMRLEGLTDAEWEALKELDEETETA